MNGAPIYVSRATGLGWLRVLLVAEAVLLLVAVVAIALYSGDAAPLFAMIGGLALVIGVILLILPQRYEVWPNRLRLVFVLRRWDIPFDTIAAVRPARWWESYGGMAVRLATSPGQAVVIERVGRNWRRLNVVLSPENRDEFIARLNAALERYRGGA